MDNSRRIRLRTGTLLGTFAGLLVGLALALTAGPLPAYPAVLSATTPSSSPTGPGRTLPATTAPATPTGLDRTLTVADYIIVVSALYAVDGDRDRARARLDQLDLEDGPEAVADLAETLLDEGRQMTLVIDLSTLARDLGVSRPVLLAYAATPVPKPRAKSTMSVQGPTATPTPALPTPTALPTLDWDIRLSARLEPPVKVVPAQVKSGQTYWRLIRAWWQTPEEGHNAFHVFANVLNEDGITVSQPVMIENGGKTMIQPELKPDSEYLINYPMTGTLGSYSCYVAGDLPSDRIEGLGLGFAKGGKDHTVFILLFQETVAP